MISKNEKNKWWRPTKHEVRYRNVGRPTVVTESVLAKLEQAFIQSFTDEEACLFAWISPDALYNYIKKNPDFGEKKEALKKSPAMKAKNNIVKNINMWDIEDSKRWLERKSKKEFSTKQELDAKVEWKLEWIKITLDE